MVQYDLEQLLHDYVNPAALEYQEWINVGMALKKEGYPASTWDNWSKADPRYKPWECFRKWDTFKRDDDSTVSGGTIVEYAKRGGFMPPRSDNALDWDSVITDDSLRVVDSGWLEEQEVEEPDDKNWQPVQELITYLQTLFQSTENVGYVTDVYENDNKLSPKRGNWDRTAGQLIEELRKCNGDIGAVIGDCNPKAGAWIRFNPLDGNGVKNDNVTDYRYALVESDSVPVARQNAIMREMELPIACMVYSGGKSVHAIVRVEASDYAEYRKRVDYLYKACEKNGLKVDTQNKNPSRLSRLPGVIRDGHKQFLMATNIGKASWDEWKEWIEGINDDLPDFVNLADVWNDPPPLAGCLIEGVLRQGHKMLLAGPSKAGKSYALMELAVAIAEGKSWLIPQFRCTKGRVLYVNLEVDSASAIDRIKQVYAAMKLAPLNVRNITIWNLRGHSTPMDKLAPKLIRRAEKGGYSAVIIDPIYKVITGDENSADQMALFCNQFDKLCNQLKTAVIYCHHHSKGAQGGKKSMDRASGSGVFARDPDAMLDLAELEVTKEIQANEDGKALIRGVERALNEFLPGWQDADDAPNQDDQLSPSAMKLYADDKLKTRVAERVKMETYIAEEQEKSRARTAWRIEGTLREFAPFKPLNLWFQYPIHVPDECGQLGDIKVDDGNPYRKRKQWLEEGQRKKAEATWDEYMEALAEQFADGTEEISYKDVAETIGKSPDVVKKDFCGAKDKRGNFMPRHSERFKEAGYIWNKGKITRRKNEDIS